MSRSHAAQTLQRTRIKLACNLVGLTLAISGLTSTAAMVHAQSTGGCTKGFRSHAVAEVIFGRNIGDFTGAVSDEEWQRFLDEVVTPRFPDGLTVVDGYGQWWNPPEGRVEREPTKILTIVLKNEAQDRPRVTEIAADYKRRFSQQSVIVKLSRGCVAF